ncbi:D-alanyl-D-alanine carboxypeptidase family protein [Ancylobacter terrae]|uniref:D-alanyl-D-alanine carboxypeptidase family protein n=1 Tax=Ancylobacter sp. sgz301288 TaxID=3342077 RepID=UPI00385E5881
MTASRSLDGFFGTGVLIRALAGLMAVALLTTAEPAAAQVEPPAIGAVAAILIDYDSGTVLYEKSADQQIAPASLTKLMTMAVVFKELREKRLTPDTEFTVSEYAWRKGGAPSGSSAMFAALNSRVAVHDLMRGVIIQSGNDAAIVFAEGIAGNEMAFAGKMNDEAKAIGLTNSDFRNSNGLPDPDQKTTARDMSRLAIHIIRTYPEYYAIYGEREFTWNKIRQMNRNPLLGLSLGADGLKTGFLKESGYHVVGSAVQNGQRLVVVVMGSKSEKERAEDARKLLDWGFRSFESKLLFDQGQVVGDASVHGGTLGGVPLTGVGPIRVLVARNGTERVTAKIQYTGPIEAPVAKGAEVARLRVFRGEQAALDVPLVAAEDVPVGPLWRRAVDGAYELGVTLVRQGYAKFKG